MYIVKFQCITKKNEIMTFRENWAKMEIIVLNKMSETQKEICGMFSCL